MPSGGSAGKHEKKPRKIWHQKLPLLPYTKPTWKRGQDGGTAIRIRYPEEAPMNTKEFLTTDISDNDHVVSLERPFFTSFDHYAAQDATLEADASQSAQLVTAPPKAKREQLRRDSMQDSSMAQLSQPAMLPAAPVSPAPTETTKPPPVPTMSTKPSVASQRAASTPVPRGLEVDVNAGLDPHKPDDQPEVIRTYLYKGRRYQVTGDEPEEWLQDVRVVQPTPRESKPSMQPTSAVRRTSTPDGFEARRSRHSLRTHAEGVGDAGRRRSSRRG